MYYNLNY